MLLLSLGVHRAHSWSENPKMLVRSVWSVRLEPVHDQTGDFGFALEVREVPDIGQDHILGVGHHPSNMCATHIFSQVVFCALRTYYARHGDGA
jgi:hypothetical protein